MTQTLTPDQITALAPHRVELTGAQRAEVSYWLDVVKRATVAEGDDELGEVERGLWRLADHGVIVVD